MSSTISHIILRKNVVKADWKLVLEPKKENHGRKVLVNEVFPKSERPIVDPEWQPEPQCGHSPVLETGYGGTEIGSFTEHAAQDRHKHLVSLEIYTVLKGKMTIRIADTTNVTLETGDEIVVLPGVVHEVLESSEPFLTRVHAINCHGPRDKYVEENGVWCQAFTLRNQQK
jgi:mannose-6-phosphate isomerase-like protein (cupin superfamily)